MTSSLPTLIDLPTLIEQYPDSRELQATIAATVPQAMPDPSSNPISETVILEATIPCADNAINSDQLARWRIFASTFVTIFLAELGDKTQITTLLMTAESHSPWIVFVGAASALITSSLLGVLLGQWLAQRVSPTTLDRVAGVTLLVVAGLLIWDVIA